MTITQVQAPTPVAGTTTNTLSVSWGSATTAGNTLLGILQTRGNSTAVSAPTGMTLLADQVVGTVEHQFIYIEENCQVRSGSQTFSWTTNTDCTMHLVEYSGLATSSSLDVAAEDGGSAAAATILSGTTATTSQANELWFAALVNRNVQTQTGTVGNSFSQINRVHSGNGTAASQCDGGIYERIVSGTGTASTSVDLVSATARNYGGLIVTLKEAAGGVLIEASNSAEGGSDGTTVSTGNSGGASGDAWDFVSTADGTMKYETDNTLNTGSLSYQSIHLAAAGTNYVVWWGTTAGGILEEVPVRYYRAYFRFPTAAPSNLGFLQIHGVDSNFKSGLWMATNGKIGLYDADSVLIEQSASSYQNGSWYRIELLVNMTTGEATANIYFGHSTTILETLSAGTGQSLGSGDIGSVRIGAGLSGGSYAWDIMFDDVATGTSDWIGPSGSLLRFLSINTAGI